MELRYFSESGRELTFATTESAGLDLPYYDPEVESYTIMPGERAKLPTGVYCEIPVGHFGLLDSRSSTSKLLLDLLCRTIDADYRGNIFTVFTNVGDQPVTLERGKCYFQMLIIKKPNIHPRKLSSLEELTSTDRGEGGFGSTGEYADIKGEK